MNKKLLTIAIASALTAPLVAQAVDFKVSGRVNRAIMFADDGTQGDYLNVDGAGAGSRWRITGSGDIGNGMKAGLAMEQQWLSNSSNSANIGDSRSGTGGGDDQRIRLSNVWFSGNWGKVTVGRQWGAAFGAPDFGPAGDSGINHSMTDFGGGISLRCNPTAAGCNATGFTTVGASSVGAYFASFNGNGRTDALRYDTPKFGPATVKVSVAQDSEWEVGLNLAGDAGGGKYGVHFGYTDSNNRTGVAGAGAVSGNLNAWKNQWLIQGTYLFSQGTSATVGYGKRDRQGPGSDPERIYANLGHRFGNNGIEIDYGEYKGVANSGSRGTGWGIGFTHQIPKPGVELYAAFRNFDLSDGTTGAASTKDVNVFSIGSRIDF